MTSAISIISIGDDVRKKASAPAEQNREVERTAVVAANAAAKMSKKALGYFVWLVYAMPPNGVPEFYGLYRHESNADKAMVNIAGAKKELLQVVDKGKSQSAIDDLVFIA
jgi:hypothetical protein